MKPFKKDKSALNMLYAVAVVAILIIAALLFLFVNVTGSSPLTVKANISIKNMETGEIITAEVDLSDPDGGEAMIMSFGGGVRATSFSSLEFSQKIPRLDSATAYQVWASAQIDYWTTDIQKANLEADFTAKAGDGYDCKTTNVLNIVNTMSIVKKDNVALPNGATALNMFEAPAGMTTFGWENRDADSNGQADVITGYTINNMVISVTAYIRGWTTGSQQANYDVSASAGGSLRLLVDSYTGVVGLQVSSMWASGTGFTAG